jgi:hypothetical protein
MNNLLKKILFQASKQNKFQWIVALSGTLVGFVSLLISILLLNDINHFKADDELFGPNSVIVQKKVTKFTSIGLNSTAFTEDDIQQLKEKDFILEVAPFKSTDYGVGISEYPGDGLPPFYADMFFQSVPDKFIDIDAEWSWQSEDDYVPIILPRQFLILINYGIAQSQGLPQISEDLLKIARLKLHIKGQDKQSVFTGKVVGFSHKISAILVPETFLKYTNNIYGSGKINPPQRLFLTLKEGSYGDFKEMIDLMALDINQSDIDLSKIKTIVSVVISIFIILSILIVILAVLNFLQYIQLMLSKAATEIEILKLIGYHNKMIQKVMMRYLFKLFGIITVLAIAGAVLIKFILINPFLKSNGLLVGTNQIVLTFFIGLIGLLFFNLVSFVNLKKIFRS